MRRIVTTAGPRPDQDVMTLPMFVACFMRIAKDRGSCGYEHCT